MASQGLTRLLLDTLTASLKSLEAHRASENAAEAAGATPGPGAAPGCGELLRAADRHVTVRRDLVTAQPQHSNEPKEPVISLRCAVWPETKTTADRVARCTVPSELQGWHAVLQCRFGRRAAADGEQLGTQSKPRGSPAR